MTATTIALPRHAAPAAARTVPASALAGLLYGLLAAPQLLLWHFLGFATGWLCVGAIALAALGVAVARAIRVEAPRLRLVAGLFLLSVAIYVLGGEGRFLYANSDWQVRDAVLRDLVVYPWPWAYTVHVVPEMLRLPLGMYVLPAMIGKAAGYRAAEFTMLAQHAAMLTALLALGSSLFAGARARWTALAVLIGFSGMDILGMMLVGGRLDGHLEWWSLPQYSSHITQAFWVPQHAMAGWIGALLYLLWRERRVALAGFLIPLPLLALWSPLALMGVVPFAAHAGLETILGRKLRAADVALPLLAVAVATPGLLYLAAGSGAVGGRPFDLPLPMYIAFETLEVAPYLLAAAAIGWRDRFGGMTLLIVAAILLVAPFIQIGHAVDFVMRASIPALAILAVQIADILARPMIHAPDRLWRIILIVVLAIGAVTPLSEIRRSFVLAPSPSPGCSYFGIVPEGAATYVAPLANVPNPIRPVHPALIRPADPATCWAYPWPHV